MKDKTIGPVIKVSFGIVITLIAAALIVTALGALFVDTPLLDIPPAETQDISNGTLAIPPASVDMMDIPSTSVYVTVLSPKPCTVEALILCRSWPYCKTCKPACDVSDEFWDRVEARLRDKCGKAGQ